MTNVSLAGLVVDYFARFYDQTLSAHALADSEDEGPALRKLKLPLSIKANAQLHATNQELP